MGSLFPTDSENAYLTRRPPPVGNITARSFGSPNRYGRQQLQADRGQDRDARWLHAGPADDPIHQGGSEARGADRGDHRAGAREAPVVRMVGVAKAWPGRCENETSAEQPPGGTMARCGLRMMPPFPSSPLKFRTVGFPQYGFKAGVSGGTFPIRQSA